MIDEEGESDTESDDITEAEKKFKMLAKDEEVARKVQEEWEAEEEKKRLAEEEATKVALTNEYDFIQARINADKILAEELQKEEREKFTIEQRAKFLHDTIAAQRKFLAQQRSEAIRNKPPTRNQLRNQMMTYLKHVGGKKHSDLKTKTFEEIQKMGYQENSKGRRYSKGTAEQEVTEQGTKKRKSGHVKMIARKRPRPQPVMDSCTRFHHKMGFTLGCLTGVNGHFRAFNYSNGWETRRRIEWITPRKEDNDQGDFWNNQQEWEIVRWRLYEACGVCILELKDGTIIYMLVEDVSLSQSIVATNA
ncbi:hypothetical protein Tco_1172523 [Tanacetum coccineum]